MNNDGKYIIILNRSLDSKTKNIVCGHELGHLLLHKNINTYKVKEENESNLIKYEMEADYFCSCLFLIEFEELYKDKIEFMSADDIVNITELPERLVDIWLENIEYNINITEIKSIVNKTDK